MPVTNQQKSLVLTAVISLVVVVAWFTPFMWPFKILVVYFHEMSHVVATYLTGGRVVEFSLNVMQGGHVVSIGGNRFITLSAGYLGSLGWGLAFLWAASNTRHDRYITGAIGIMMCLTPLLGTSVGVTIILLAFGLAFLALARFTGHFWNDLVLRCLGIVSMIYVPLDIISDTLLRSYARSDARMLAEEFGGATILWGGIWLLISLWVLKIAIQSLLKSGR